MIVNPATAHHTPPNSCDDAIGCMSSSAKLQGTEPQRQKYMEHEHSTKYIIILKYSPYMFL